MKKLFFLFILAVPFKTFAASCCGGGFSVPALILGDDKAQLTSTYSYANVSDDVLSDGRWLKRDDKNLTQTLKLEGALLLSESLQGGFGLPVLSKTAESTPASQGIGDIALYLGHETFPETSYSRWKPKGVTFIQINLPTSPSIYDFSAGNSNESRGKGFYSVGAGVALTKSWVTWDANFSAEIHRSFARAVNNEALGGTIELLPGWGSSQTVGLGWNYKDLRLGGSVVYFYEDAIESRGGTSSDGAMQRNFTASLSASYMLGQESALTASYSDQALLGDPTNSSLSKTINVSYQKRWPR
ncbi:MAG: serine protease spb1 [Bdellovibrio sp.]|nr:serine protease spb1 [Bdellovibrio sp.]